MGEGNEGDYSITLASPEELEQFEWASSINTKATPRWTLGDLHNRMKHLDELKQSVKRLCS